MWKHCWERVVQSNGDYFEGCHGPDDEEYHQRGDMNAGRILFGHTSYSKEYSIVLQYIIGTFFVRFPKLFGLLISEYKMNTNRITLDSS